MKILHVAHFARSKAAAVFYNTDNKISTGLTRLGCRVENFCYRDTARLLSPLPGKFGGIGAMNRLLKQTAVNLQPDLLLLGHAELVHPDTLAELRRQMPQMRTARWWVDSLEERKMPVIRGLLPHLDAFFTSHGADFARKALTAGTTTAPVLPTLAWLPPLCDSACENRRAFERDEHEWDLFFAARPWKARRSVPQQLRELLPQRRLGLIGEDGNLLFGQAYMDAIGQSRTGLNFSIYNDVPFYSSDRLIHLAGNGTLVVSTRVPGLAELCSGPGPGTNQGILFFDNLEELPDLLDQWLTKDRWREAAQHSWQQAHSTFACENVCQWLLDISMGRPLSAAFAWGDQLISPSSESTAQ